MGMDQSNLIFIIRIENGAEDCSHMYPEGLQEQCEKLDEVTKAMVC
jgi:hypothetical protein